MKPKKAGDLREAIDLVLFAMSFLDAIPEGIFTEAFDEDLTNAYNILDDAITYPSSVLEMERQSNDRP